MKTLLIIVSAVFIVGCSQYQTAEFIMLSLSVCEKNEGTERVFFTDKGHASVYCNNGARFYLSP